MKGDTNTGWAAIQRPAALSYWMMMSPSLRVSQGPPNPAQNALPGVGPITVAPVVLSKTSKVTLTHSTNCVAPTAPLVSGGTKGPPLATVSSALTPSKLSPILMLDGMAAGACATGSGCELVNGPLVGCATANCCDPPVCEDINMLRNGPDTSCFSSFVTTGSLATAGAGSTASTDIPNPSKIAPTLSPCINNSSWRRFQVA